MDHGRSDTQSFPFEVKSSPRLWDGAYSSQEKFTQLDVASVVEYADCRRFRTRIGACYPYQRPGPFTSYQNDLHAPSANDLHAPSRRYARLRGVRVIVEFDMPGHAGSWCTGYPEICPSPTCLQPLNVANPATFEKIEAMLHECTGGVASAPGKPSPGVFKDNFIHLGGDEVNTACWGSTPSIAKWLSEQNMTADDGYAYFVKKVAGFAIEQGHRPVQWSEVYDHFKNTLPKKVIIHIWKSVTNVTEPLARESPRKPASSRSVLRALQTT